jgi:hypothetical protein
MWRFAILLLVLLPSPALAQKSSRSLEPVLCEEEKDCLAKLRGKVSRKGRVLTIKLENGRRTNFEDSKTCASDEENCITHWLSGYRPAQGIYLVSWSGWEDSGSTVVSAETGQAEEFGDTPEFSPSGSSFVILGGEYGDRLSIWSLASGEIKQEFTYTFTFFEAREAWLFLGWDGENRIRLRVTPAGDNAPDVDTDAVFKEQGWVLNWPFPH